LSWFVTARLVESMSFAAARPIAADNLPTTNVKQLASQSWIVVKTFASNHVRERGEARLIGIPRPPTKPAEVKQKIHRGGPIFRPNTAIAPGSGGRTVAI